MIEYYQNQRRNCSTRYGGSIPGHIIVRRDRETAHKNLFNDYFFDNPWYDENFFTEDFECHEVYFFHIVDAIKSDNSYFKQQTNVVGRLGLSSL